MCLFFSDKQNAGIDFLNSGSVFLITSTSFLFLLFY